jgi:hypothetical protein
VRSHGAGLAQLMYRRICFFSKILRASHERVKGPCDLQLSCARFACGNTVSHIPFTVLSGDAFSHVRYRIQNIADVRLTVQQRTESPCTNHEDCGSAGQSRAV